MEKNPREVSEKPVWGTLISLLEQGQATTAREVAQAAKLSEEVVESVVFSLNQRGFLEMDDAYITQLKYTKHR